MDRILGSPAAETKMMALSGADYRLSGNITPGYITTSMTVHEISPSWVVAKRRPAFIHSSAASEEYEHVAPFLRAFVIQDSHHAKIFYQSSLCWIYSAACEAIENGQVTDPPAA